jgi:HD-GYP domain-containing protein (c-di-GMP phosphodiesterase class II)
MKRLNAALCVPSFLRGEMIGFLVLGPKLSGDRYTRDDMSLLLTLANNAAIALENSRMYEELKQRIAKLKQLYEEEHGLFMDAASAFSYAIDAKDGYTHTHTLKVSDYSFAITDELKGLLPYINFDERFYDNLRITSLLHDVGKIGISDKILKKEGGFTPEEEKELKRHVIIGETILHPIREISDIFELIRHHHENFDGTGYPDGLKGNDIPLISRIIAVANAYDTMTSDRPHRQAISKELAVEEIKKNSGTQFDPVVVKAFVRSIVSPKEAA